MSGDRTEPRISLASKVLQDHEPEGVIDVAARLGFRGIEWFCLPQHLPPDTPPVRVADLARRSRDAGLQTVCLSTYIGGFAEASEAECDRQLDLFARYVEIAGSLGCPLLRVWPDMMGRTLRRPVSPGVLARVAHQFQRVADRAAEARLNVGIEMHLTIGAHLDLVLPLLDMLGRPNVGLIYDPGNLHLARVPYGPEVIGQLGNRILHVQVKDASVDAPTPPYLRDEPTLQLGGTFDLLLGEGEIAFAPLLETFHAIGYPGWYSVECHAEARPDRTSVAIAEAEFATLSRLLRPDSDPEGADVRI